MDWITADHSQEPDERETGVRYASPLVPGRVDAYLDHLDRLFAPVEATFTNYGDMLQRPAITSIAYDNTPETGVLTAFTYGLSLAQHPAWMLGKPELAISVDSRDPLWGVAIAVLAEQLQGRCPFVYGNIIEFGSQIGEDSEMDSFIVLPPIMLDPEHSTVEVSDVLPVNIVGMYPIYDTERVVLQVSPHRLPELVHADWDPMNVNRPRVF